MNETDPPAERSVENEVRTCPQCGRPAAVQERARCAWCGATLPWAEAARETNPMSEEEIALLLERSTRAGTSLPQGLTYPKVCAACTESLPDSRPEKCPTCHTAVRDPFTGRLVYGEDRQTEEQSHIKRLATILACLILTMLLLGLGAGIVGSLLRGLPVPRK